VAFERALGKVIMECDVSRIRAEVVQQDIFTQARISSSRSKHLTDLNRALEECQILLCLQETDQEVQEAILAEEQEHGLHPPDGQDLSVELDRTRTHADRVNGERDIEAGQLS
jgi:hypothetical protein